MAVNCHDGSARSVNHYSSADLSDTAWTNSSNWRPATSAFADVFVGATAPSPTREGLLWFDPLALSFAVFHNGAWRSIGATTGVIISEFAPALAADGTFWFNSIDGSMLLRYGGQWISPFSDTNAVTWDDVTGRPAEFPSAPSLLSQGGATIGQTLEWSGTAWVPASGMRIIPSTTPPPGPTTIPYAWWDPDSMVLSFWDADNTVWVGTTAPRPTTSVPDNTYTNSAGAYYVNSDGAYYTYTP